MVKDMFKEVGITGKSNHSLRTTGATCLYSANGPETIIQQRTGHQSLKSLRTYERTSEDQHQALSNILTEEENVDSSDALAEKSPVLSQASVLKQLQVSNAPNISSLLGMTSNCVINVNFGASPTLNSMKNDL